MTLTTAFQSESWRLQEERSGMKRRRWKFTSSLKEHLVLQVSFLTRIMLERFQTSRSSRANMHQAKLFFTLLVGGAIWWEKINLSCLNVFFRKISRTIFKWDAILTRKTTLDSPHSTKLWRRVTLIASSFYSSKELIRMSNLKMEPGNWQLRKQELTAVLARFMTLLRTEIWVFWECCFLLVQIQRSRVILAKARTTLPKICQIQKRF